MSSGRRTCRAGDVVNNRGDDDDDRGDGGRRDHVDLASSPCQVTPSAADPPRALYDGTAGLRPSIRTQSKRSNNACTLQYSNFVFLFIAA